MEYASDNLTERTIDKKYAYRGKIISLRTDNVLLPNGSTALREIVEHPGGVCIGALDEDGSMLFVRQYRYAYEEVLLEAPAGKREKCDDDPFDCAVRELKEETGAKAERLIELGKIYPAPGYDNEVIFLFLAIGLTIEDPSPDEDEFLKVEKIPFEKALKMAQTGEICDGKTVAILMRIAAWLEKNGYESLKMR